MSTITRILRTGLKVVTESKVSLPHQGGIFMPETLRSCKTTTTVFKPNGELFLKRIKHTGQGMSEMTPFGKVSVPTVKESLTLYPISKQGEKEILARTGIDNGPQPLESVGFLETIHRWSPVERETTKLFSKPYSYIFEKLCKTNA